jgi:hypothetical protein
MDGTWYQMDLGATDFVDGKTIFTIRDLPDGDHQLFATTDVNPKTNSTDAWVDYIECVSPKRPSVYPQVSFCSRLESSTGNGFDLIRAGTNASTVPKEAVLYDDTSPSIVKIGEWTEISEVHYYDQSLAYSTTPGSHLTFTFTGVAVWYADGSYPVSTLSRYLFILRYYGDVNSTHGTADISVDGGPADKANAFSTIGLLSRQLLWSKVGLAPGTHNLTLTHADTVGRYVTLDFFRCII